MIEESDEEMPALAASSCQGPSLLDSGSVSADMIEDSDEEMPALAASSCQGPSLLDAGSVGADIEPRDFSAGHLCEEDPVEAFFRRDEARFWEQEAEETHEFEPPLEGGDKRDAANPTLMLPDNERIRRCLSFARLRIVFLPKIFC